MSNIIEIQEVSKTYHIGKVPVHALRGVSLTVERGQFITILGPSGSGKSTMMNVVGALDVPTEGRVFLRGRDISTMTESELAQLRGKTIGFVFQQFNLISTYTAQENVMLPMIFQDVSLEQRQQRSQTLLDQVGLGDRMDHKPTELSGGQQQRVAIARALANDPDVILADEPTGNLDSKTGQKIMDLLWRLNKNKGKTVIIVTHDVNLVENADRTIRLHDGKIKKTTEQ